MVRMYIYIHIGLYAFTNIVAVDVIRFSLL